MDQFTADGLSILYSPGDSTVRYGIDATNNAQPFAGIVIHHTGASGQSIEDAVNYGHTYDEGRDTPGYYGYHFYIAPDGSIVQGAPLSVRTNHVSGHDGAAVGLSNSNAIGISLLGAAEGDMTPEQEAAAIELGRALAEAYGINSSTIINHGSVRGPSYGETTNAALDRVVAGITGTNPTGYVPVGQNRNVQVGTLPPVTNGQPTNATDPNSQNLAVPVDVTAPNVSLTQDLVQSPLTQDSVYHTLQFPNAAERAEARALEEERSASLTVGLGEAWSAAQSQEWALNWLYRGDSGFEEDPNYRLSTEEYEALIEGLPEQYHEMFLDARSAAHAQFIRDWATNDLRNTEILSNMGLGGAALRFAAAFSDPTALAAGAAGGYIGAAVTKGLQIGRGAARLVGALFGGASEAAYEATGVLSGNPNRDASDILWGAAFGASLGALFSPTNARIQESQQLGRLAQQAMADADATHPNAGSVGAARTNPGEPDQLTDEDFRQLANTDTPEQAFVNGRPIEISAAFERSPNDLTRPLGQALVHNGVGMKDGAVNRLSASEQRFIDLRRWTGDWARTYHFAWKEWAKEQGLSAVDRVRPRTRQAFGEQVTAYMRATDPSSRQAFPKSIQQAGDKTADMYQRMLDLQQNPWLREGEVGRPVAGFDRDIAKDKHWVPRMWDTERVNKIIDEYGWTNALQVITRAIKAKQPTIDPKLAEKFSNALLRRARSYHRGVDEDMLAYMSGGDLDALRKLLEDVAGDSLDDTLRLAPDEIDAIIESLGRKRPGDDAGSVSHGRHRVLLDENFEMAAGRHSELGTDIPNGKLKMSDFFNNDASFLFAHYSKAAAGNTALARMRFVDPKTNELIIDGITSDAEWRKALDAVKKRGKDQGLDDAVIEADIERLDFVYNNIKGRPLPSDMKKYADWLRLARKFNIMRIAGQFGFAQVNEFSNIVTRGGLRAAFTQMPAFRRMMVDGESLLKDGLGRELESIGFGTDRMTGLHIGTWVDSMGGAELAGGNKRVRQLNETLEGGVRGMMDLNMMRPITRMQELWAAKVIAQKFANMATRKGGPRPAQLARMKELGLSEEMLTRVLDQISKKASTQNGVLFNNKITLLNLDNWTDQAARAAFETGISRWVNNVIQRNDIGQLAKWMSHPLGQTVIQFRSFMLAAYSKQLLHNLHLRDWESFVYFTGSMVWSAMTYTMWTYAKSIGREDQQEYLREKLSLANMAAAGFSRVGWASLLPALIDSGRDMIGLEPWFAYRSSGLGQELWYGNPTMSLLFDDSSNGTASLVDLLFQRDDVTTTDASNVIKMIPFASATPFMQMFNLLSQGVGR